MPGKQVMGQGPLAQLRAAKKAQQVPPPGSAPAGERSLGWDSSASSSVLRPTSFKRRMEMAEPPTTAPSSGSALGAATKSANTARWNTAAKVYGVIKVASAFNSVLTLRQRMAEHVRKQRGSAKLWGLAAGKARAIGRFKTLGMAAGLPPISRRNEKAPDAKDSMSFQGKTNHDVLARLNKKELSKKGVQLEIESGEEVSLAEQGDIAFETNEARMSRVKLRRSPKIRAEITEWWVKLGFSGRTEAEATGKVPAAGAAALRGVAALAKAAAGSRNAGGLAGAAMLAKAQSVRTPAASTARPGANLARSKSVPAQKAGAGARGKSEEQLEQERKEAGVMSKRDYVRMSLLLFKVLAPEMCDDDEARESANAEWKSDSQGLKFMKFAQFFDSIFQLADLYTFNIDEEEYVRFLRATLKQVIRKRDNPEVEEKEEPHKVDMKKIAELMGEEVKLT